MFARVCPRRLAAQQLAYLPRRCAQKTFSSSSTRFLRRHRSSEEQEEDLFGIEIEDEVTQTQEGEYRPKSSTFWQWLEGVGPNFRDPKPRNWLGGDVPFPLNPSFKPPTPLSDALRTQLYQSYMPLSSRHSISIKRVDAILRLKGLEEAWKKRKPLQTGFTRGMEWLLAVPQPHETVKGRVRDPSATNPRYDVEEADQQDEAGGTSDMSRLRYQRMFWENVPEGEDPIMPTILEDARSSAQLSEHKAKVTIIEPRPGRPAIKFVDVGNAFFDVQEQERRDKEGARRAVLRARKRGLEWAQPDKA
ncbi:eukaryotic mitochondrial regulator protein-domain-containing protein [Pisolithus microcarpus]|nr:eukaryotic mitochondrial regulator protein-domain-containing protein [Pisolithus microcarpus]